MLPSQLIMNLLLLTDLFENDGLPIYRIFTWRCAINRLTRWRELTDYLFYAYDPNIKATTI